MDPFRFLIEYGLFRIAWGIFAHAPQRVAFGLGKGVGRMVYMLDSRHRAIALANLEMAMGGQRSLAEIRKVAQDSFLNLASSFVKVCRYRSLRETPIEGLVDFEGVPRVRKAKEEGRGVMLITAHLGSWELGALAALLIGYPLQVVFLPFDNPYLDQWVARVRSSTGNQVIPKRNALRAVLSSLRNGGIVVVLMDLNTMRGEGAFVDFFGKSASTTSAPALLALRTGAAVFPILTLRQGNHWLKVIVGEELPLSRSGNLQKDLVDSTAHFTRILEEYIRQHPEQWFWPHERWKTRPKSRVLNQGT
jgi:KDO2-lipid IV(A) lauroyltransferase